MNLNKKIFLLFLLFAMPLSAIALNPDGMTDADHLQKSGYSPEAIRLIRMQQDKVNGEIVAEEYQPKQKPDAQLFHPTTWFKSFIYQLDPAEQGDDFGAQQVDSL